MKITAGAICLMILMFLSCSEGNHDRITELNKEILATHDSVMPLISKVLSQRRKINALLDSNNVPVDSIMLQNCSYALTKADAGMMDWMHNYKVPENKDSALAYLEAQRHVIAEVRNQIHYSLSLSDSILKMYEK